MKPKLIKDFEKMFKYARRALGQCFNESKIDKLHDESRREYAILIPQLPYIGGKKNSGTMNLIGMAIILAIIRSLEREGLTKREIGKVVYETFDMFFKAKPRLVRWLIGKLMTSKLFMKKKKKQTEKSLLREYPEDFVTEFVEGDGENFDFGLDVIECAICKFYKKQDAEKYLPYLCPGDYAMFRALGIGLTRTQTIGNGAPKCDFRFKKGGETPQGWPPENLEEFNKGE